MSFMTLHFDFEQPNSFPRGTQLTENWSNARRALTKEHFQRGGTNQARAYG